MVSLENFTEATLDAFEHLYDIAYLCESSLLSLIADRQTSTTQQARQLHNILLSVIEDLDPGPKAPISSHEWRRHRLLMLRYIDGLPPQAVADRLSISRRHFYREHREAVEMVASILYQRATPPLVNEAPIQASDASDEARRELMRLEA